MSLSASVGVQIPTNVIEVGNEISQVAVDAIAASSSPSNVNPLMTSSAVSATYAPKASPTFTGVVTIPAGASISGYLTTSSASSTYQPIGSYLTDAPSDGSEYVRKNAAWSVATGGGGGGLTISTLSNAATSTLNATAPTTGQSLTFDGTQLIWASVGGGGGVAWGAITGTVTDQTDLTTYITNLGYITAVPTKSVYSNVGTLELAPVHKNNIIFLITFGTMSGCILQIGGSSYTDGDYPIGFDVTVVCDLAVSGSTITPSGSVQINGAGSAVSVTTRISHLVKVGSNTWFYH